MERIIIIMWLLNKSGQAAPDDLHDADLIKAVSGNFKYPKLPQNCSLEAEDKHVPKTNNTLKPCQM